MEALEVGHLWRVTRFYERFKTSLYQRCSAATKHRLLAEQIGFGFFTECGLNHARSRAANARRVRQRDALRLATRILCDSDQTRHPTTANIGRTHSVTWSFRRDHDHVQVRASFDQTEMHV